MKKTLCLCFFVCLLLAVLPMFSSAAITASGETPAGFSWTLTDDGTLTVSGNGALDASPWSGNWPDITRIVVEEGITSLREMAFAHCRNAEEIILPETVVEIGARAFSHCEALKSITVPSGVKRLGDFAFEYCSALTTVTVPGDLETGCFGCFNNTPVSKLTVTGKKVTTNLTGGLNSEKTVSVVLAESVTEIGERAFYGFQNLTELTLPKTLRTIGEYAFYDCSALKSVTVPPGVKRIGAYAFSGCSSLAAVTAPGDFETEDASHLFYNSPVSKLTVTGKKVTYNLISGFDRGSLVSVVLAEGITEIGDGALGGFYNVTEITLPKTLKSIGKEAFSFCTSLKSLALPDSLTQIGEAAFYNCSALTRIDLPAGIKTIEKDTFYNCSGLKKVSFPGGLVSVGECAFRNCTSLAALQFGAGLKEIGICAFEGCTSLKTLKFGEGLEKIGSTAFGDCSALTGLDLPAGLKTIGSYAFYGCSGLKKANFPGGLVSVGESAFRECTALAGLDLPAGLKTIGDDAFSSCTALAAVSLPDSLDRLGARAFSNCTALKTVRMPLIKTEGVSPFLYCSISELTLSGKDFTSETLDYIDVSSVATLILEPGFTEIGENAFSGFSSMTRCEIGEGVVTISSYTFSDCGQLSSLTLPKGLETIEEHAFAHCRRLSSLTLPEGLKTIGDRAFEDCESLQSLTLPDTLTSVGDYAFPDNGKLKSVALPASVTTLGWQFDMPKIIRTRRALVYPDYSRKPTLTVKKTGLEYENGYCSTNFSHVYCYDPVTLLSPDNELYAACGLYTDTVSLIPKTGGGTVTFTKKGFTCGAAQIGSDGKLYLLWGRDASDEDFDKRPDTANVIVSRYERSGKELSTCRIPLKQSYASSPFHAGNAALTEHNGTLFIFWNVLWVGQYTNDGLHHQGLARAEVRMRDMKLLGLHPNVGSHSFGVAAIETGRGVAYVQNNDGFPRGMDFAETELQADGYVSSASVLAFSSPGQYGTNEHKLDGNKTYFSSITLARSRSTFAAACYGTDVYTSDVFYSSPLSETARYDVYVRILDESLSTNAASDCAGSVRKNEKDGSVADRNLVRLTKLSREEEVNNLQAVTLPSGAYCVLWNQRGKWSSESWELHYAVLDERGNILKADTALTGAAMCDYNVGPVVIGSKLVWAYCDAGKLTWATLDLGVDTVSQFLLGDVDLDGSVTAADARLALRGAVGLENYKSGSAAFKAADADRDKKLTAGDARMILRAAVGLEKLI